MGENIEGNLFVLTGVGQLRNVYGFIDQYHATDNVVVVLYTVKNLAVVENIKSQLKDGYFKDVRYVQLPVQLLEEDRKKSKIIYSTLENVIKHNVETNEIKNLFLCSSGNYYIFFERICRKNNLSINWLEEGLGTYKVYLNENDERNHKITATDLGLNIKTIFRRLCNVFESIIKLVEIILELFINLISLVTRINVLYYVKKLINKFNKYKYGLITKFDSVYVCYPELMKSLNADTTNVKRLKFNYENADIKFTSDEDKENVLFINQKYGIRYKEHFPIVFSILKDMGVTKVYIKFHPKENPKDFIEIFEETMEKLPELEVIPLYELSHIPVENLINTNSITKIIALTSSSLFYSKLVKEDIETISIAEEYKKRCIQLGVIEKRMKLFLEDYESLTRLFPVEQFQYDEETNSLSGIYSLEVNDIA